MEVSKESLQDDEDKERDQDRSDVSRIFRLIKDMASDKQVGGKSKRWQKSKRLGKGPTGEQDMDVDEDDEDEDEDDLEELSLVDIRARVLRSGFTEAQLMETIVQVRIALFCLRNTCLCLPTVRRY